jgi:hypothetical protein
MEKMGGKGRRERLERLNWKGGRDGMKKCEVGE